MFNIPTHCPTLPVIIGAIITAVGWPASAYLAYRSGWRSQRMRIEWEALKAKESLRKKFIELADQLKANICTSERSNDWADFFKDNVAQLISSYETIRADLAWKEKKRMDEAMNSIKRFASMSPSEIRAACASDSELIDALKKLPEQ